MPRFIPDESFLKLHYTDTQNEMRWRREVEYKLLSNFILVLSILITAQGLVYPKIESWTIRRNVSILFIFFSLTLTILLSLKIKAENKIIKQLGDNIVKLWEDFGLFIEEAGGPFLPVSSKKYGKGPGYKITLSFFWFLWISFSIISFTLAYYLRLV
jgi:hypothetical protein